MPRKAVQAGLPSRDIFPEAAKESARAVGLTDLVNILRNVPTKEGGVSKEHWVYRAWNVRAAIESVRTHRPRFEVGGRINEDTSHLIYFDPTAEIRQEDRIERNGKTWAVLSIHQRTDQPTIIAEAKEL